MKRMLLIFAACNLFNSLCAMDKLPRMQFKYKVSLAAAVGASVTGLIVSKVYMLHLEKRELEEERKRNLRLLDDICKR